DGIPRPGVARPGAPDLSCAQCNVPRVVRGAGSQGASCGDIAGRMVKRDPDITRLLDRMEERGLVRRFRDADDRRVVMAAITEAGRALIAPLDDAVPAVHRRQLGHMSRKQLETLAELLALARTPPP